MFDHYFCFLCGMQNCSFCSGHPLTSQCWRMWRREWKQSELTNSGNEFGFNLGFMLMSQKMMLLRASFKNRIEGVSINILKTVCNSNIFIDFVIMLEPYFGTFMLLLKSCSTHGFGDICEIRIADLLLLIERWTLIHLRKTRGRMHRTAARARKIDLVCCQQIV